MTDKYVYKISSRYLQKIAEIWHKTCQTQALFTSFRGFTVISRMLLFYQFWRFKKRLRVIFRILCENLPKTCIAALNHDIICLTFFTWWPEKTLACIMVTKHKKSYLQMLVILSMPIHCLCLRLTSKFYSPMSPSPKCQIFWLWPDLWRHWWPRGH